MTRPTSTMADVVVAGLATIDLVARPVAVGQPIPVGSLQNIERVEMTTGGFVSNASIALARLGIRVAAVADLGDDVWSKVVVESLGAEHIETAGLLAKSGLRTPVTVVLVDQSGERSFLFASGCADRLDGPSLRAQLDRFSTVRWFLFGYYSLFPSVDRQLADLFADARSRGMKTALDSAGDGGDLVTLTEILPFVDCYFPNLDEARQQTGLVDPCAMIDRFRQCGAAGVVGVKMGERGAIVSDSPGAFDYVPVLTAPADVVDTTGAGDAFVAGFVAAQVRGLSTRESLSIAAASSACCVRGLGASSGLRGWDETQQLASSIRIDRLNPVR